MSNLETSPPYPVSALAKAFFLEKGVCNVSLKSIRFADCVVVTSELCCVDSSVLLYLFKLLSKKQKKPWACLEIFRSDAPVTYCTGEDELFGHNSSELRSYFVSCSTYVTTKALQSPSTALEEFRFWVLGLIIKLNQIQKQLLKNF